MQVFLWMRDGDFAKLDGMLEVMVASGHTRRIPAIRDQVTNDISRVPTQAGPHGETIAELCSDVICHPTDGQRRRNLVAPER
jgi:hypothetical protein